jgi:hypothetical protein
MRVIYTSKGMSKKFWVRVIYTSTGMSKTFWGARYLPENTVLFWKKLTAD